MSQATSTFWDERVERSATAVKVNPVVRRRVRSRRLIDAIVVTIILAAAATCFSVYSRARGELDVALVKHEAAGEKVTDLTIRVQKLERDVQQLRTDSRAIELFARQKFGFVRSGDVVIKLPQDPGAAAESATEAHPVRMANLSPRSNNGSNSGFNNGYTDASN